MADTTAVQDPPARLTPHVALKRVEVVVNRTSGSVGPNAVEALQTIFEPFGLDVHVAAPEPSDIPKAVKAAVAAQPDLVVVLAGDGTARLAASLAGPRGPLVAPLPGGTMNMLPRALYGTRSWQDALAQTLANGRERMVPAGEVNGEPFYVAAMLGSPALWAEAREAVRKGKLGEAWSKARFAMSQSLAGRLKVRIGEGGETQRAEALTLLSPLVSRACEDDDALEAAILDIRSATQALRVGLRTVMDELGGPFFERFGGWREDATVAVNRCTTGYVWARRRLPTILDGEQVRVPRRVQFHFRPEGFRALAPPPEDAAS